MVGRRTLNAFENGKGKSNNNSQHRAKPVVLRFQDASNKALEDERRTQIKNKLIDAVKGDELEAYRKSDDEVCYHESNESPPRPTIIRHAHTSSRSSRSRTRKYESSTRNKTRP